jgi:predicted amidophosphoribosyltransferase
VAFELDECIYCGELLTKWESTRSYCWKCNETTSPEAFHEESDEALFQSS